jgi:hypothetical protein
MSSEKSGSGDERNAGFGAPENVMQHKPGYELASPKYEAEGNDSKDHRRQPRDAKDIPQTTLAQRLRAPKGGK